MISDVIMLKTISIHASAKEATANGDVKKEGIEYFNPRLREGGDYDQFNIDPHTFKFQSTPPRRRRQFMK